MAVMRALANPAMAFRKVGEYGFGRTVIHFMKRFPDSWTRPFIGIIRLAKIAVDPFGYIRRKSLGRKLIKSSAYRDFFPEDTAFRIVPPGTFEAIDAIIPVSRKVYERFLEVHPSGRANKSAYSYLLSGFEDGPADGKFIDLTNHPEFQDLALSRPLVEMATSYLGEVPIVSDITLQVTWPNDTTEGFQRFHIDRIDHRQFKIFIAIEDVDEGNGATMVMPADVSAELARSIGHIYGRIPDDVVLSDKWRPHVSNAEGPAGSAFIFDTCRCVHCGARTRTKPRIIIQLQYVSKYCHAEGPAQLGGIKFDKSRTKDEIDRLLIAA